MRIALLIPLLALPACGKDVPHYDQNGQLVCDGSDVVIYTNRFTPSAGASGVATPTDALNGRTSSDPNTPIDTSAGDQVSAMTASCGSANCAAGQVAVELPSAPSGGGGGLSGAPVPEGRPAMDPSPPGGSGIAPPVPAAGTMICTAPPPACPKGESPQFTGKQTWECTDCSLIVTYGGEYGNYRRCAAAPTLVCPDGQVPTWVFENEDWECQPTCDNGQYDQHVIGGQLVCVPC